MNKETTAAIEILIHEIQECPNMDEVHKLLQLWIKGNDLHPEKVRTMTAPEFEKLIRQCLH